MLGVCVSTWPSLMVWAYMNGVKLQGGVVPRVFGTYCKTSWHLGGFWEGRFVTCLVFGVGIRRLVEGS